MSLFIWTKSVAEVFAWKMFIGYTFNERNSSDENDTQPLTRNFAILQWISRCLPLGDSTCSFFTSTTSTSWSSSGCTITEPLPLGTELGLDDCRGLVLLLPIPDVSAHASSRRLSLRDLFCEGQCVRFAEGTNIVGGTCCCICCNKKIGTPLIKLLPDFYKYNKVFPRIT